MEKIKRKLLLPFLEENSYIREYFLQLEERLVYPITEPKKKEEIKQKEQPRKEFSTEEEW